MNDLDICLEVVSRSCQKPLEIEAWLQRATDRIWHMGYRMVTWPMTSRDPQKGAVKQYGWLYSRQLGFLYHPTFVCTSSYSFATETVVIGCCRRSTANRWCCCLCRPFRSTWNWSLVQRSSCAIRLSVLRSPSLNSLPTTPYSLDHAGLYTDHWTLWNKNVQR